MMRKIARNGLLFALVMIGICPWLAPVRGEAAQPCGVTFSAPAAAEGTIFTVNVLLEGPVGAATIWLSYDADNLLFLSASGESSFGGEGSVVLDYESQSQESVAFQMVFLALQAGSTDISCLRHDIVDGNGDRLEVSVGSCPVTVKPLCTGKHSYSNGVCSVCGDHLGQVIAGQTQGLGEDGTVTLLMQSNLNTVGQAVLGNGTYYFEGLENGSYYLEVSRPGYVTRRYPVEVAQGAVEQAVEIHRPGDLNGDGNVNTLDVGRANGYCKRMVELDPYELACADVSGDGKVNTLDVGRMNAHVKKINPLW